MLVGRFVRVLREPRVCVSPVCALCVAVLAAAASMYTRLRTPRTICVCHARQPVRMAYVYSLCICMRAMCTRESDVDGDGVDGRRRRRSHNTYTTTNGTTTRCASERALLGRIAVLLWHIGRIGVRVLCVCSWRRIRRAIYGYI